MGSGDDRLVGQRRRLSTTGVVFAYASVELVGKAAGGAENPEKVMLCAINSVIARIALFYVGSLVLLSLLLPYTAFKGRNRS